nr:MAG TPA: hypothetical protein [Caudoviricetes sp.]
MANSWVLLQVDVLSRLIRLTVAIAIMRNRALGYLD